MSLLRFQGRVAVLACLFGALVAAAATHAQAPSAAAPQTATQNAAPASSVPAASIPTPEPASSLPSLPGYTQQDANPPATQNAGPPTTAPVAVEPETNPPATANPPAYHDPLQQPINLPSGASAPVSVTMPQPAVAATLPSAPAYDFDNNPKYHTDELGSTYIPVDSPVYTMALRLYSLGYLNTAFIGMRPWTRRSLLHMLDQSTPDIMNDGNQQAEEILAKLDDYLAAETPGKGFTRGRVYGAETLYTRLMGIGGPTLRDSFHLGQTFVNDYGRPYEAGFNNITGFSTVNEMGRFSLYVRGEYQHAPSGAGYPLAVQTYLSCTLDFICPYAAPNFPQATIPQTTVAAQNPFRLQEAALSFHVLGHEISGGKTDAWLGPAYGGAMAWSNNAENIYSFRINRVEPLHIPLLSDVIGPLRYDFFVGSLKGHTDPNSPWIHSEMFSFRPTRNFEFAFQRAVIWGGEGHEPVTLHTFLRSFFSVNDTEGEPAAKNSAQDPGARFSDFSFSWRLPFLTKYVTLYTDSIAHDDVSPISAPRRAAYRPGIFLSQFPHLPRLDLRVEAASTDTSTLRSLGGTFNYFEAIQLQGYTNKGFIMGDWIGRESKGGDAWLTYHLSGDEWVQLSYLNKKTPKDFIPGGTTQNQVKLDVVKRLGHDVELNAWAQFEAWKAPFALPGTTVPLYKPGQQHDFAVAAQFTWYPKLHTEPHLNGK